MYDGVWCVVFGVEGVVVYVDVGNFGEEIVVVVFDGFDVFDCFVVVEFGVEVYVDD